MLNMHTMTFGKSVKGFLGHDCFLWGYVCHEVYICGLEWSTKMVAALYLYLVSFPSSWAVSPTFVAIFWSIYTHSPGFIALKKGLPLLWDSFIHHYFFVIAPKWHPAHLGGLTFERYLVISPNFLAIAVCQMKDVQDSSASISVQLVCHLVQVLDPPLYWLVDWNQRLESPFDFEMVILHWQWKGCAFGLPLSPTASFL